MSESTPKYQTDNHVYSYCVRQIEGLKAERDSLRDQVAALQKQVAGLADERNGLRSVLERARRILARGRTVGRDGQKAALDAENLLIAALGPITIRPPDLILEGGFPRRTEPDRPQGEDIP